MGQGIKGENRERDTITKLREELLAVRNQNKILKGEITSIEEKFSDPVTHENSIKHQEL